MSKSINVRCRELGWVAELRDSKTDINDAPEVCDLTSAVSGRCYRSIERPITVRIDVDIQDWFAARAERVQVKVAKRCGSVGQR